MGQCRCQLQPTTGIAYLYFGLYALIQRHEETCVHQSELSRPDPSKFVLSYLKRFFTFQLSVVFVGRIKSTYYTINVHKERHEVHVHFQVFLHFHARM